MSSISFQILVKNMSGEKKNLGWATWQELGIKPFIKGIPRGFMNQAGIKETRTLNHLVDVLDQAIFEAFQKEGLKLHLDYNRIIGDDGETCLVMDIISYPQLEGRQQMTLFELLDEIFEDFPDGFVISTSKGFQVVYLQPLAIEFENDPYQEDEDF